MLFNSFGYLVFFPAVLLVYHCIPQRIRYLWLLGASYFFYACWDARFILLIFASTLITYMAGLFMEKTDAGDLPQTRKKRRKKAVAIGSVCFSLAILFFFKYLRFAADLMIKALDVLHIRLQLPAFSVVLPVGISFYTFQALGYTIDVYRGEIPAEKNFFRYALFVSFFPQLVAGPIERSRSLLAQMKEPVRLTFRRFQNGILLMLWGFYLKIVIADRAGVFVDTVYADYKAYPGFCIAVATILFAVQIYCDFAGYSTIAMGSAYILGIQLMDNFDAPYLSVSVAEFWRRWHISLTSWFRDYLYVPLGGNKRGKARMYLNKMIVFLVSGLWHGASVSFVLWGALNGMYQIAEELSKPLREKIAAQFRMNGKGIGYRILRGAFVFALIDFSWIFFRAERAKDAFRIIRQLFTNFHPEMLTNGLLFQAGLDPANFLLLLLSILLLLIADCRKRCGSTIREDILRQKAWIRSLLIALAVCGILLFGKWGPAFDKASFIYFQF